MSAPTAAASRTGRRGLVALVVLVLLGVVVVLALGRSDRSSEDPLSPTNARPEGSRALARLLEARGTSVTTTSSLDTATGGGADRTVLVVAPDSYAAERLRALAAGTSGPVVLLAPGDEALAALGSDLRQSSDTATVDGTVPPGCDDPAARAAGPVAFAQATAYTGGGSATVCYSGAFARSDRVAALGDPTLLTNDALDDEGVAALDLNLLGSTSQLVWLQPGADTGGPTGTVWTALPDHAEAAALWLLGVGLLLVLWRGRRLGAPVTEPLPVVVRADELVRGRARLYVRAGATDRAAAVLRAATTTRVARLLALPPGSPPVVVTREAARVLGAPLPGGLLEGPAPGDGEGLLLLARDLVTLEERVRSAGVGGRAGWSP